MNIILVVFDSLRKDCLGADSSPPWGAVHTPNLDRFAEESLVMAEALPETLPTLPARRAIYTGRRVYPFHDGDFHLHGDFVGAPGWGPIPEEQPTVAELLSQSRYRTGLVSDLYHMFKPSKNFWRGFHQWTFLRGQEIDSARSGPRLTQEEVDYWLPSELQNPQRVAFIKRCITNMRDRTLEEDFFSPQVFREAALWLEQNRDAERFFLTVESFDPHEPWLVPEHYRRMYLDEDGREQVLSLYGDVADLDPKLLERTRANYSGSVTLCDRWFGFFLETLKAQGRLDDTMIIVTSDHGHSIGERGFMGKRGYPSVPEVFDIPLMVRFPGGEHAGSSSPQFVQHHDIAAVILEAAAVEPPADIEGVSFLSSALSGNTGKRDHATVGWGSAVTVVTDRWWLNCKADGSGVLLYDRQQADPFQENVADENVATVNELFALARADAVGGFPHWILDLAHSQQDAPGCSELAARA